MSRIGKLPIIIPEKVSVTVNKDNKVTVKGPLGELHQQVDPEIIVTIKDNVVIVNRPNEQKRYKALHGLYRSLIFNMV